MAMSPGPALLLASTMVFAAGLRSGLATSGNGLPRAGGGQARTETATLLEQRSPYAALLDAANDGFDPVGVAALKRGMSLRSRDSRGAAAAFADAAVKLPALEDWALLLQAEVLSKSGDTVAVRAVLDRVEPGLVVVTGWRSMVAACRAARSAGCAVREAGLAVERAPDSSIRAAAATQLGLARLLRADTVGAMTAFRVAIDAAPGTAAALEAGRSLANLRTATAEDRLILGRLFFRHGNADRGTASFQSYLASGVASPTENAALSLELARALYAARRYSVAEPNLVALAANTADRAVAAEAKVLLGRTRLRMSKTTAGLVDLEEAVDNPAVPAAARAEALFLMADTEDDRGATGRARELYLQLLDEHPSSPEAADAAMRLGGAAFAAGRYASAADLFDRYRAHSTGAPAQQAAFWAAQSHFMAGDTAAASVRYAEARSSDPTSLYGLRAAEHLDMPLRTELRVSPAVDPATRRLTSGAIARMTALRDAGVENAVATELGRIRRLVGTRPDGLYAIAESLNDGGMPMDAVRLGREIQRMQGRWDDRLLRIVYPLPYREEIVAAASRRGLDPWFVAGLIRQESLFLPTIKSGAGAVGLMQVMPATGRELARRDGLSGFAPSMLTDPAVNIRLGTLFIADLLRRHDGNVPYALAAYNAGPSRVTRWLRLPDNAHPDVFAERIPFPETRDYVRIVQQNARIYAELYGMADSN